MHGNRIVPFQLHSRMYALELHIMNNQLDQHVTHPWVTTRPKKKKKKEKVEYFDTFNSFC
jgi:hypothetical protein